MASTLTFTDINQKKFNLIMDGIIKIFKDSSKLASFSNLKSMKEAFEFLQTFSPGNYSENDFAKFLLIIAANIYYSSSKYARHELFELTLSDIKKRTGTDFKKYLQNFRKLKARKVSDDDLDLSGGIGNKRIPKMIAGSLAALVPFSAIQNSGGILQAAYNRNQKSNKSSSWFGSALGWVKEHWKPIAVGAFATAIGGFVAYKRYQSSYKYSEAAGKLNDELKSIDQEGNLSTRIWDYFVPNSAKRIELENAKCKLNTYNENKNKIKEVCKNLDNYNKDYSGGDIKLSDNKIASESAVKILKKYEKYDENLTFKGAVTKLGDISDGLRFQNNVAESEREKVRKEITKDSDKTKLKDLLPGLGAFFLGVTSFGRFLKDTVYGGISDLAKQASEIAKFPTTALDMKEKLERYLLDLEYQNYRAYDDESQLLLADNISKGLGSVIKGQKVQMERLGSLLAAFNMQARMAGLGSDNTSVLGSPQTNSRCVFLSGPSGTGKSMLADLVKKFTLSEVGYLKVDLSGYKGDVDVNTYLGKQADFTRSARGLNGKFVIVVIEEIDKICRDQVVGKRVNDWLHSVYDTGKIGGGEKDPAIQTAADFIICTCNDLPSINALINGQVAGLNIQVGDELIKNSNSKNYIDILRALSKNASRELPIFRTGALASRSEFIEFNQTSDDAMKEIIDMHLQELNQNLWQCNLPVKLNYSDLFVEKLARLRHAKSYKDGGSRTIINDILKPIFANITSKIGDVAGEDNDILFDDDGQIIEDNLKQIWLDYSGVDASGKLIIDLKENEKDAKCDGKEPDMYEEEISVKRKPELEKFIQGLMNNELDSVLSKLAVVFNSGVVTNWDSVLGRNSKSLINNLSSLVNSSAGKKGIDEQVRLLIEKRNELVSAKREIGILDDEWEALKELRDIVDEKTHKDVKIKKNKKMSEDSIHLLSEALNSIQKIKNLALSVNQYDLFSANNRNSLKEIFGMFPENSVLGNESNMTLERKLDELIDNTSMLESLDLDFSESQHNAIANFVDSVNKQISSIENEVSERANEMDRIFDDILAMKNNFETDYDVVLGQTDSEFLKSLIEIAAGDVGSASKISEQLNFVLSHRTNIKSKLLQNGITGEQLANARSLKSKIQQNFNKNNKEKTENTGGEEVKNIDDLNNTDDVDLTDNIENFNDNEGLEQDE